MQEEKPDFSEDEDKLPDARLSDRPLPDDGTDSTAKQTDGAAQNSVVYEHHLKSRLMDLWFVLIWPWIRFWVALHRWKWRRLERQLADSCEHLRQAGVDPDSFSGLRELSREVAEWKAWEADWDHGVAERKRLKAKIKEAKKRQKAEAKAWNLRKTEWWLEKHWPRWFR